MLRSKGSKRCIDQVLDSELGQSEAKKVRSTTTPGTLRLMKDIECLENDDSIVLELGEEPGKVTVEYRVDQSFAAQCPNRFEVTVLKRYPHEAPLVCCLDQGFACRFIHDSGTVVHPAFGEEWNAICSLTNVVEALQAIRGMFLGLERSSTLSSQLFAPPPGPPPALSRSRSIGEGEEGSVEMDAEGAISDHHPSFDDDNRAPLVADDETSQTMMMLMTGDTHSHGDWGYADRATMSVEEEEEEE